MTDRPCPPLVEPAKNLAGAIRGPAQALNERSEVTTVLRRTGIPLGLRPDTVYHESGVIELLPGQMLLMLTDGYEEAVNPEEEMFGTDAVLEIVKKNRDRSAADILQILHDQVRAFTGNAPQLDDLTAILVKVK